MIISPCLKTEGFCDTSPPSGRRVDQPRDRGQREEQPPRMVGEGPEVETTVKGGGAVVAGFDHDADRRHVRRMRQGSAQGVKKQQLAIAAPLKGRGDRQPTQKRCRHQRVARQLLDDVGLKLGRRDGKGRQRVIAGNPLCGRIDQNERRGNVPSRVLPRVLEQVPVKLVRAGSETFTVVRGMEGLNPYRHDLSPRDRDSGRRLAADAG